MAYLARLIIHRYAMLGLLDEDGMPVQTMGILETPERGATPQMKGARCPECGNYAVIKQGRLRFLQRLRVCGGVRVETKEAGAAYTSDV